MYSADFETTVDLSDCRVWAWSIVEVGNLNNIKFGNCMETFMELLKDLAKQNEVITFHNLKFDGEFIIHYLLSNGFRHITTTAPKDRQNLDDNTFTTLISDTGVFYEIEIVFKKFKTRLHHVTIRDSLKVLPMSVEDVSKAYNLPMKKLSIDYAEFRPIGHELTNEEIDYITNDVVIVAEALRIQHEQGLTRMTTASNALASYKEIIGKANFERWFPEPDYDSEVRQAYKGGFTYANPRYAGKVIGKGIVLDVNSLYPAMMYYKPLPYGEPIYFTGEYKPDHLYKLYIQILSCNFEIKPDHIPTIQLKNILSFLPTEYATTSKGMDITLCLTSVDLELFKEHYNIYNLEYVCGWKFKQSTILFKDYIDKWYSVKEQATIEGNYALRACAKLMLNGLYGKFSVNPNVRNKIPFLADDGRVLYRVDPPRTEPPNTRKPLYVPVGAFITAWARDTTIRAAQKVFDRFLYADTDSLHLIGTDLPNNLEISPTALGAWKHESTFDRAKFIRAKTYIEQINGKIKVTCAGLPANLHPQVTFDNFTEEAIYYGKLKPTHVSGGIVLTETDFTIRG